MLYEIAKELQTALVSKRFPFKVLYGPGAVRTVAIAETHVRVDENLGVNEEWGAPPSAHSNPRVYWQRKIQSRITIYANSTVTGARTQDHERLADKMADMVASAIYVIGKRRKLIAVGIAGRWIPASELENKSLQQWPGAIYEMAVSFSRSVQDLTWADEKMPEVAMSEFETHSEITDWTPASISAPAEDACATHYPVPEGD